MADHVEETTTNTGRLALNNTTYDVAKEAVTLWLPGLATLYMALAGFWDLPKPNEVVGTITAIATFLGLVLKVSTASYNNGKVDNPDNTKTQTSDETIPGVEYADPSEIETSQD